MPSKLQFIVCSNDGEKELAIDIKKLLCVGFAGRNQAKVMEHIAELEEIGVKGPKTIPELYVCSNMLVTQEGSIQVLGDKSSGEVEFVLILKNGKLYIGLGSDHTDRALEAVSIPKSKQICAKPIAKELWLYEELKEHWDELELKSWMTINGEEKPYQDGKISAILPVEKIINEIKASYTEFEEMVIFSGTVPVMGEFVYGEKFRYELKDPILNRKIQSEYFVEVLS